MKLHYIKRFASFLDVNSYKKWKFVANDPIYKYTHANIAVYLQHKCAVQNMFYF